jgi:hypothetical protein
VTLKNEVFWVEEITLSLARGIKTVTVLWPTVRFHLILETGPTLM